MPRKLPRFLSILSAFFGLFTFIPSPKGRAGGMLWLPKLWAGAWSPFLAIMGMLGMLLSLPQRDMLASLAGVFGAFAGIRHTMHTKRRHGDPFAEAFGADWEQSIPIKLRARFPRPYMFVQPQSSLAPSQRNINVGQSFPLLCDLWLPPAGVNSAGLGVIFLHGGLWQAVDKDFLSRPLFRRLAEEGYAVLDVAYSLAPGANIYQMLDDVKCSVVWMKTHAAELGLNPERIVLMGSSGGAHLALLAAYTANMPAFQPRDLQADTTVRGVISLYGITDLAQFFREYGKANPRQPEFSDRIAQDLYPRVHDASLMDRLITRLRMLPAYRYSNMPGGALLLVNLLGGALNEIPEVYDLFSPIHHVSATCPPTLLLTAGNDFVTDSSHSRKLHEALRSMQVPSVYIDFPDAVHAFDQYIGVSRRIAPAAQLATSDIEHFLGLLV